MDVRAFIEEKKRGGAHRKEDLFTFVEEYVQGSIPDYQVSAWLMAVCFQGLNEEETSWLTEAMVQSGERVHLDLDEVVVDKHSTGGVADTTTLVLAPLVASAGVPVAKMSGRSLGHTGGTLDKLESIPGFQVQMSIQQLQEQLRRIGVAIISQSPQLVPADRMLYALRDVTATVDSIPLIASSIMSKKIAAGSHKMVLDVKVGDGAFMQSLPQARELARRMVGIGQRLGRECVAVLTDMNQPVGRSIGNALEVREAISLLRGNGSPRLEKLCLTLGAHMLVLAKQLPFQEAEERLRQLLHSGAALQKFQELIQAQGGDPRVVEDTSLLPGAPQRFVVRSPRSGYVSRMATRKLGALAMSLGASRAKKGDAIHPGVGIELHHDLGEYVEQGEPLFTVHALREEYRIAEALLEAVDIGPDPCPPPRLVLETICG